MRGISKYAAIHGPWSFCKMPPSFRDRNGIDGILKFAQEWGADGIMAQLYNTDEIKKLKDAGICVIAQDFHKTGSKTS